MDNLIIEDFEFNDDIQIVEEEVDGVKKMKLKGILSESDTLNRNHRFYPKAVLKEAFDAVKANMNNGTLLLGELEHPSSGKINLDRIAVTFPVLEWVEGADGKGRIIGEAVPTETPCGNIVKGLAKSGIRISFSTRCAGKTKPYTGPLSEGATNCVEVLPGLKMIAIDVVATPSCQRATSETVYESVMTEEVHDTRTGRDVIASIF